MKELLGLSNKISEHLRRFVTGMETGKAIFRDKGKVFSEIIEGKERQMLSRETEIKMERRKLPEMAGAELWLVKDGCVYWTS